MVESDAGFMIRKRPRRVNYKEQSGFFRLDYGRRGEGDGDEGCIPEEDVYGYDS